MKSILKKILKLSIVLFLTLFIFVSSNALQNQKNNKNVVANDETLQYNGIETFTYDSDNQSVKDEMLQWGVTKGSITFSIIDYADAYNAFGTCKITSCNGITAYDFAVPEFVRYDDGIATSLYKVIEIDSRVFTGAYITGELKLPDSIEYIGNFAFGDTLIEQDVLVLPLNLKNLGILPFGFNDGMSIKSFYIPSNKFINFSNYGPFGDHGEAKVFCSPSLVLSYQYESLWTSHYAIISLNQYSWYDFNYTVANNGIVTYGETLTSDTPNYFYFQDVVTFDFDSKEELEYLPRGYKIEYTALDGYDYSKCIYLSRADNGSSLSLYINSNHLPIAPNMVTINIKIIDNYNSDNYFYIPLTIDFRQYANAPTIIPNFILANVEDSYSIENTIWFNVKQDEKKALRMDFIASTYGVSNCPGQSMSTIVTDSTATDIAEYHVSTNSVTVNATDAKIGLYTIEIFVEWFDPTEENDITSVFTININIQSNNYKKNIIVVSVSSVLGGLAFIGLVVLIALGIKKRKSKKHPVKTKKFLKMSKK